MKNRKRQAGSALFVAVLMLAIMGALGLAALETVTQDRQAAGFLNRAKSSFYAAEAAAAQARSLVRTVDERTDTPAFPTDTAPNMIGDLALYDREAAQPTYYGDPAFPTPIRWIQDGGLYTEGGNNLQLKGQKFVNTLWQINVVGQSPDGSSTRLEVMETKILTGGY